MSILANLFANFHLDDELPAVSLDEITIDFAGPLCRLFQNTWPSYSLDECTIDFSGPLRRLFQNTWPSYSLDEPTFDFSGPLCRLFQNTLPEFSFAGIGSNFQNATMHDPSFVALETAPDGNSSTDSLPMNQDELDEALVALYNRPGNALPGFDLPEFNDEESSIDDSRYTTDTSIAPSGDETSMDSDGAQQKLSLDRVRRVLFRDD